MPQRESAEQRRVDRADQEPEETTAASESSSTALTDDVDAILDEIDSVLEANAEDFVKSFVQKGGQ